MAKVKIRYYQVVNGRAFWKPSLKMKKEGFEAQSLGPDGPAAWAAAEKYNAQWDARRKQQPQQIAQPYVGSLKYLFDEYRKTGQWGQKSNSTRKEWEYVWKVLEPVFGDVQVADITFQLCDTFYGKLLEEFSLHKAHRTIKVFRALLNVAIAFDLITANPTAGIKNKAPRGRESIWSPQEVEALAKKAWNEGFYGLSVAIRLAYDTELQPVDIRALTPRQRAEDKQGVYFETRRAKTGKRAYATLSKQTAEALDRYLAGLGFVIPADQPMIRNRSGSVYTKDKLAADFRAIRNMMFEKDTRRMQDMRRTGNVEAAVGGAQPQDLSAKAGNTIAVSNSIFETYTPVQLEAVRRADKARKKGRKALNRNAKS